jgi:hypothetical protein
MRAKALLLMGASLAMLLHERGRGSCGSNGLVLHEAEMKHFLSRLPAGVSHSRCTASSGSGSNFRWLGGQAVLEAGKWLASSSHGRCEVCFA